MEFTRNGSIGAGAGGAGAGGAGAGGAAANEANHRNALSLICSSFSRLCDNRELQGSMIEYQEFLIKYVGNEYISKNNKSNFDRLIKS